MGFNELNFHCFFVVLNIPLFLRTMEFLYPNFLWALGLLSIPILVHLFYFRRYKKVYFTNVRFLRSVQEEQSTWRKIRNLLVLLARMLALTFLVLAFAQPFIPQEGNREGKASISIYIDNSFSMNALAEEVSLLDEAKSMAMQIVSVQDVSTQFQILDNALDGASRKWLNQEGAMERINGIGLRPEFVTLDNVQRFQQNTFRESDAERNDFFLISDFQQSSTQLSAEIDSSIFSFLLPLQPVQSSNISLDSIWFDRPVQAEGQTLKLFVQLTNHSAQSADEIDLVLKEKGQTRPLKRLSLLVNESKVDTLNYTPFGKGWQVASVAVSDYPVEFDDEYLFAYRVPEQLNILTIYQAELDPYLSAALEGIDIVNANSTPYNQVNYASLGRNDAIVLQDIQSLSSGLSTALENYIREGGNVLVFPSADSDVGSYNQMLTELGAGGLGNPVEQEAEVFSIEQQANLFEGVFERKEKRLQLPKVSLFFTVGNSARVATEPLMRFRQGSPFLQKFDIENGSLVLCYAPIARAYSNLSSNGEIFVPVLIRSALLNRAQDQIAYTIGASSSFSVPKQEGVGEAGYNIQGPKEFIPLQRNLGAKVVIDLQQEIETEGVYQLMANDSLVKLLAFNYDRTESDLKTYTRADLEQQLTSNMRILDLPKGEAAAAAIDKVISGVELWKWCIILSIVFLILEQAILRLWKLE